MSLLKSLRGTIQNVQQDFTTGLKSLSTQDRTATQLHKCINGTSIVNFDAGADLLQKHHMIWEDLYKTTDEAAKKAQDVDTEINKMWVYYDRQSEFLTRFHEHCGSFPMIISQLQEITVSLAKVDEEVDKVEAALVHLEDICEGQDLLQNKQSHQNQLSAYKFKKAQELEKIKIKLAQEHAQKVEVVNKKRQSLLKERQIAFQEQFSQDVDFFKKHGRLGRLPSTSETEKNLKLAEIEIEVDDDALKEFLGISDNDGALGENIKDEETADQKSDSEETPHFEIAPTVTFQVSKTDTDRRTTLSSQDAEPEN